MYAIRSYYAIEAMKSGAIDYITKPFTPDEICNKISIALDRIVVNTDESLLRRELSEHHGFDHFIGTSREMEKVYRRIMQVAPTSYNFV